MKLLAVSSIALFFARTTLQSMISQSKLASMALDRATTPFRPRLSLHLPRPRIKAAATSGKANRPKSLPHAIKESQECIAVKEGACSEAMLTMAKNAGDISDIAQGLQDVVETVKEKCSGPDALPCANKVTEAIVFTTSGIPRDPKLLGQELDRHPQLVSRLVYGSLAGLVLSLKYTDMGSHLWSHLISQYSTFDLVVWVSFIMSTSVYWGGAIGWRLAEVFGNIKPYKIQYLRPILSDKKWFEYAKDVAGHQLLINLPMVMAYYLIQKNMGVSIEHVPSLFEFFGKMVGFIAIQDTMYYILHKAAHENRWLFKLVHSKHHKSPEVYAVMANYASFIEHALINMLPIFVGPTLLQSDLPTFWYWIVLATSSSINAHSGYNVPFLGNFGKHDAHHSHPRGEYSSLGPLDEWGGTSLVNKAAKEAKKLRADSTGAAVGDQLTQVMDTVISKLEVLPNLKKHQKVQLAIALWLKKLFNPNQATKAKDTPAEELLEEFKVDPATPEEVAKALQETVKSLENKND